MWKCDNWVLKSINIFMFVKCAYLCHKWIIIFNLLSPFLHQPHIHTLIMNRLNIILNCFSLEWEKKSFSLLSLHNPSAWWILYGEWSFYEFVCALQTFGGYDRERCLKVSSSRFSFIESERGTMVMTQIMDVFMDFVALTYIYIGWKRGNTFKS